MKTTKKMMVIIALVSSVLLSSCKVMQLQPLTTTEMKDMQITGVSLSGIKAGIPVTITNPNPVDVKVFRSHLGISINDIQLGKATMHATVIPANSSVQEMIEVKPSFSHLGLVDIPKAIAIIKIKELNLSINGNIKSGQYFHKTFNRVNVSEKIDVKEKVKPVMDLLHKFKRKAPKRVA